MVRLQTCRPMSGGSEDRPTLQDFEYCKDVGFLAAGSPFRPERRATRISQSSMRPLVILAPSSHPRENGDPNAVRRNLRVFACLSQNFSFSLQMMNGSVRRCLLLIESGRNLKAGSEKHKRSGLDELRHKNVPRSWDSLMAKTTVPAFKRGTPDNRSRPGRNLPNIGNLNGIGGHVCKKQPQPGY